MNSTIKASKNSDLKELLTDSQNKYYFDSLEDAQNILHLTLGINPNEWQWSSENKWFCCDISNDIWVKPCDLTNPDKRNVLWFTCELKELHHKEVKFLDALKKYATLEMRRCDFSVEINPRYTKQNTNIDSVS